MQALTHQKIKKFFRQNNPSNPKFENIQIAFLLQSIDSAINVGHFFRLADAVNAHEIVLTGKTPDPATNQDIKITSMGNENRINYTQFKNHRDGVNHIKEQGFKLYGLEVTDKSKLYTSVEYPEKVCFVMGNETDGIYPDVLSMCNEVIYIPMLGKNFSLNVHIAAAIASYHFLALDNWHS